MPNPITGIYRFTKADSTTYFVYSQDTHVYYIDSGNAVDTGATVANNAFIDFKTAYDKLIFCDGSSAAQTWDGTTVAKLCTDADDQAATVGFKQTVFTRDRLFGFSGTHDQSLVYYSLAGNIYEGYSDHFIPCDVSDGQKITGLDVFFIAGELQPVIVVTKERKIGAILGSGTTADPFTFVEVTTDVGALGCRQIVQHEQDAFVITPRGIQSYQTALKNVNIAQELISKNIFDQFTGLSQSTLNRAFCWNDWKNKRVSFAVPTKASRYPDVIWHFDVEDKVFYKQTGFTLTCAFVDTDGYVYTGTTDGKILKQDPAVNSYDGDPIECELKTGFMDFFEPELFKEILQCEITTRGHGTYDLDIITRRDFKTTTNSSHTIAISPGPYTWGGGTWNNTGVYKWGKAPIKRAKFFPKNIFKQIQFEFSNDGANEPIEIFELVIRVKYLNKT